MSFTPSTQKDFVNPPQYVVEGTSAATFGVTPATPTFTLPGYITDFTIDQEITSAEVLSLGNPDLQDIVNVGEAAQFTITYNFFNSTLPKAGINAAGGAGTVDEHLSFEWSQSIDGTTNYRTATGCRPTSTTIRVERGLWECTQTFVCKTISNWATSGTTGATYASDPTTTPWEHGDMGATPFTWNAVEFQTRSLELGVTFELGRLEVNGQDQIQHSVAANRRISWSADVYRESNAIQVDHAAKTERTAVITLNSGTSAATLTNAWVDDYDPDASASSTDLTIDSISGSALAVALT